MVQTHYDLYLFLNLSLFILKTKMVKIKFITHYPQH